MHCEICLQSLEAFMRFDEWPFVDGNNYDVVCHICGTICREWEYDQNNNLIWYGFINPGRIATIDMIMKDGWDETEAKRSIAAVKKLINKSKINIKYRNHCPIFNTIVDLNHGSRYQTINTSNNL